MYMHLSQNNNANMITYMVTYNRLSGFFFALYCMFYNIMWMLIFCYYIFVYLYLLHESGNICLSWKKKICVFYLAKSLNMLCFISMIDNTTHFDEIQGAIPLSSFAAHLYTIILLKTWCSLHFQLCQMY